MVTKFDCPRSTTELDNYMVWILKDMGFSEISFENEIFRVDDQAESCYLKKG